jgi:hypothetical protein
MCQQRKAASGCVCHTVRATQRQPNNTSLTVMVTAITNSR